MKPSNRVVLAGLGFLLLAASLAGAAGERKTVIIALSPERNIFEQERKYNLLYDYACSNLPFDVRFQVLGGYGDILKALDEGKADGAFLGSFSAALGIANQGLVPVVRPEWPEGETHYHSYIFKRSGSPVTRDLATWKGRSFVFVSRSTMAGYYYPLSIMKDHGIDEPGQFFSSVQFSGSHDAAVWMVANDMADIGAAKHRIYDEIVQRKPELAERLEILYSGGNFPDSTLCLRSEVPPEVRESLLSMFLRMASHSDGQVVLKKFGADRFVTASTEDFEEVRQVVGRSGYDLLGINTID